jgi:cytochrome c oxidase assembly protein subunit 15
VVAPDFEGATGIEFGHRLYAGLTMLTVGAASWLAWVGRRQDPLMTKVVIGAFAAIVVQAILGAITVVTDLHGDVRLAHLTFAMITLGLLTAAAVRGLDVQGTSLPGARIAGIFAMWGGIVVLVGGSIVGQGVSGACPDIPFCDSLSTSEAAWLHGTHRVVATLLLVALVGLGVWLAKRGASPMAKALNHTAVLLIVLQIVIGVTAVLNSLPPTLRILHVGIASLIWWALVTQWVLALKGRNANT